MKKHHIYINLDIITPFPLNNTTCARSGKTEKGWD